ncbi:MAG: DUF4268 domain-containing protein [Candidatus Latescibacteria bacterium]|nr:DUF4268 domain-containing protein [Candidatus Latescibacterota bacterium]
MELQEHIDDIRSRLESGQFTNETAVSLGIVGRLLTALRWPTYDPQIVSPEYRIDKGRADYALCHPAEQPRALIEVKRVGNIDGAEKQLFEYAFHKGIPILILTDGQKWRFFHPSGSGDYTERLVHEFDIVEDDKAEIASRLNRYLSYASVQTGEAMTTIAEDYQKVFRNREIVRRLPEAWDNLVSGTSENSAFLIKAVKSETQRLCAHEPTNEQIFSFLGEIIIDDSPPPPVSRQEKYESYFQEIFYELQEQHNFPNKPPPFKENNAWYFPSGYGHRISYHLHFGRGKKVYTGLSIYFNSNNREKDSILFDLLKERESQINANFDGNLRWDRRDGRRGCSIGVARDGDIESDASELEAIKAWHIENLLKFKEVFTPEIKRALETLQSR